MRCSSHCHVVVEMLRCSAAAATRCGREADIVPGSDGGGDEEGV